MREYKPYVLTIYLLYLQQEKEETSNQVHPSWLRL